MKTRVLLLLCAILSLAACNDDNVVPLTPTEPEQTEPTQPITFNLTATRPGSVDTGKWYGVKLTVAGDNVKAWLDDELIFDEMLKPLR